MTYSNTSCCWICNFELFTTQHKYNFIPSLIPRSNVLCNIGLILVQWHIINKQRPGHLLKHFYYSTLHNRLPLNAVFIPPPTQSCVRSCGSRLLQAHVPTLWSVSSTTPSYSEIINLGHGCIKYKSGALVEWYWLESTKVPEDKPRTVPLRPQQIPHGMIRDWTRVSTTRSRPLTA
jgi:hypothetical protein